MTRVLLVEPDAPLMRVVGWILADAGFEVVCERDFEEALRALPELRPDVTVLNGDDVADAERGDRIAALRTRWPRGRVLDMLRVQAQHMSETTAADVTLAKPFHAESLVAAIHALAAEGESPLEVQATTETATEVRGDDR